MRREILRYKTPEATAKAVRVIVNRVGSTEFGCKDSDARQPVSQTSRHRIDQKLKQRVLTTDHNLHGFHLYVLTIRVPHVLQHEDCTSCMAAH